MMVVDAKHPEASHSKQKGRGHLTIQAIAQTPAQPQQPNTREYRSGKRQAFTNLRVSDQTRVEVRPVSAL